MILLCGIPHEAPLAGVRTSLETLGIPYRQLDIRDFRASHLTAWVENGAIQGTLTIEATRYALADFSGIYVRMLPGELGDVASLDRQLQWASHLFRQWLDTTTVRVVNPPRTMASNGSKPYQSQWIQAQGFLIPPTLLTNDPGAVLEFYKQHQQIIYKSASAERSIVRRLQAEELPRLAHIRWCPTQFQAFIAGDNLRVHVVADAVFATRIKSEAVDYRYIQRGEGDGVFEAVVLDKALTTQCIALARTLGLRFAGIDLKITPQGEIYCFEVNPSPGYSFYQNMTGQCISDKLALYLAGNG